MSDTFQLDKASNIRRLGESDALRDKSIEWIAEASRHKYSHHFTWMGLPIIQFPQDVMAMQEIIWRVRPRVILETGIARGGSLVFHASLLDLVWGIDGEAIVCGIDIDIRSHNRAAIESHPMARRIRMIEGSSIDPTVFRQATQFTQHQSPVLVILDSNHTHEHVLRELQMYSPLVTPGSYLIVLDTIIEDLPAGYFADRHWDVGDNPQTAVREFLEGNPRFARDRELDDKLLISAAPGGYLRCIA